MDIVKAIAKEITFLRWEPPKIIPPEYLMTPVNTMPEEGQFVAMWIYDNKIWSNTYKWIRDKIFFYCEESYTWNKTDNPPDTLPAETIKYFIV